MGKRPQREPAAQQLQHRGVHTTTETARRSELEVVRIGLLGGFRLSVGPRLIEEGRWRLRKARSLLKLLALAPGHRLHREQVMETLWPDLGMQKASNNLHYALHTVRRALEPSALASGSAAYSGYLFLRDEQLTLCPDSPLWVDAEAFEEAAATASHASVEPAPFRAAIDLYSGELLPQDRYEVWAEEKRAHLRGLYLSLLLEASGIYEDRKEYGEAIEALGRVLAEDPAHEEAHVGLMRLYAVLGRRREALGQYERLRDALHRELGSEPEGATVRLHEEIWAGTFPPPDSSLAAGSPLEDLRAAAAGGRHNLPLARTSFIGRERETLEVKRLLSMTRLLTLTGVGGSGKWQKGLSTNAELLYGGLWPGIDMAVRGEGGHLKYEFHLEPGASVEDVRLRYRGAEGLRVGTGGELLVQTSLGVLKDAAPVSYQRIGGERVPVESRYKLTGDGGYGFAVGAYDPRYPLIIDPGLDYSTFLGGTGFDQGRSIAVRDGRAYVTGETSSANFPTTQGAFDTSFNGGLDPPNDRFVTKLNASGSALAYSTFLGGNSDEEGRGIAVDGSGRAYVTGITGSSDFPTTQGALDRGLDGQADAFVTKLNAAGSALDYSTFLGGTSDDRGRGIALDASGKAYVTGFTDSSDFPTTQGAFDRSLNGGADAFVTKLPTG